MSEGQNKSNFLSFKQYLVRVSNTVCLNEILSSNIANCEDNIGSASKYRKYMIKLSMSHPFVNQSKYIVKRKHPSKTLMSENDEKVFSHLIDVSRLIFASGVCRFWEGVPVWHPQWTSLPVPYTIRKVHGPSYENRKDQGEKEKKKGRKREREGGWEREREYWKRRKRDSLEQYGTVRNGGRFFFIRSIHRVWFLQGASVFRAVVRWVHSDIPDVATSFVCRVSAFTRARECNVPEKKMCLSTKETA